MDFVIGMVVGALLSFFYWRSVIIKAIENALLTPSKEIEQSMRDSIDDNETRTLKVTVEQVENQFYLYQEDSNKFIMQGENSQEFQSRLKSMKIDEMSIVNGASAAAKALVEISQKQKEQSETSNNQ